jgi:UDP-N-acetylglucosamine:LPS N-acetylglucosamine transferase
MKRIDIYTIDIGGGHIAPAMAIKEQFELSGYKDLDVRVVNIARALNARFLLTIYKRYWDLALRYPPLINAFYSGADNPFTIKILDRILGVSVLPRFAAYLEREKPDLIVSTYFSFTHYLELFKRVGQIDTICVVLNPEPFDAHQIWFSNAFDWSMVFSEASREKIVKQGIPARKLKVFPFPIKPSYTLRREPKETLRARLGIARDPFTFLFFFGAEGTGPVVKYLNAMREKKLDVQVVVLCGKDTGLYARLQRMAREFAPVRIIVGGYVPNLPDYIAASDVVVGKSGPNQVFETLIQERPIIISSFLANERCTSDWVLANKLGWLCRTPGQFGQLAARVSHRPQILEQYRQNIRSMGLKSGAPEICAFLYDLVRNRGNAGKTSRLADFIRKARESLKSAGARGARSPR